MFDRIVAEADGGGCVSRYVFVLSYYIHALLGFSVVHNLSPSCFRRRHWLDALSICVTQIGKRPSL